MGSCGHGAERGWRPSPAEGRFLTTRFLPWGPSPMGGWWGPGGEDLAGESNPGDIMLFGNTSWMIHRIETNAGRMLVHDAHGAPPSVPFWRGEAPARTQELSLPVGELRKKISDGLP